MKAIKKIAAVLRTVGIVLLFLALALSIYNLATGGAAWKDFSTGLKQNNVSTGIVNRARFDAAYFQAMSEAASDKTLTNAQRAANAAQHFQGFVAQAEKNQPAIEQAQIDQIYAFYNNEFDAEAYAEQYEQWQNSAELREANEIITQLDALAQPAGKAGKKLALKTVSCRETLEAHYQFLVAEKGEEEVGTYVEYLRTVQEMINQAKANGTNVTNAGDFATKTMIYEDYLAQLPAIQAADKSEASAGVLDDLAAEAEKKAQGQGADFPAMFQNIYNTLKETYPEDQQASYPVFLSTLKGLIDQGVTFDGAYATIRTAVQEARQKAASNSFASVTNGTWARSVVTKADEGSTVQAFAWVWMFSGRVVYFWLAGIVLLVSGILLKKSLSAILLHKLESAGIEEDEDVLLRVNHLKQYFRSGDYVNKAVDDVSFYIKKGEVFGLVGESGCGKTTTGRTIINLYDPTEGDVYFQGLRISSSQNGLPVLLRQLKNAAEGEIKALRAAAKEKAAKEPENKAEINAKCKEEIKAIKAKLAKDIELAQDNALESSVEKSKCVQKYREKRQAELTAEYEQDIKNLTGEAAQERKARYELEMKVAAKDNIMTRMQMIFQDPIASINPRMTVREIIAEGLIIRGIKDKKYIDEKVYEMLELVGLVREHADRYPHEFSGGQRQRIGIARAIALQPDLIIADEPISALDVSIQAQVINLMNDLRNRMGLTILFIAHNLSVVKYFSDRIAVMYFGKIVEMATSDELFEHPLHPYTKSLLSAIPYPDPHYEKQRKRIEYNPAKSHNYSEEKPTMHEIVPGHFIYCNSEELANYRKELGL